MGSRHYYLLRFAMKVRFNLVRWIVHFLSVGCYVRSEGENDGREQR